MRFAVTLGVACGQLLLFFVLASAVLKAGAPLSGHCFMGGLEIVRTGETSMRGLSPLSLPSPIPYDPSLYPGSPRSSFCGDLCHCFQPNLVVDVGSVPVYRRPTALGDKAFCLESPQRPPSPESRLPVPPQPPRHRLQWYWYSGWNGFRPFYFLFFLVASVPTTPPSFGAKRRRSHNPWKTTTNGTYKESTACFAFSVLFPVRVRVLALGTSPVLQPNDPLCPGCGGAKRGDERERGEKEMRRERGTRRASERGRVRGWCWTVNTQNPPYSCTAAHRAVSPSSPCLYARQPKLQATTHLRRPDRRRRCRLDGGGTWPPLPHTGPRVVGVLHRPIGPNERQGGVAGPGWTATPTTAE